MTLARKGQKVRVHYTGKLEDGTVFDSSTGGEPLTFTLGSGEVIAGFDDGVAGMAVNESRCVTIAAQHAYGLNEPGLVTAIPKSDLPPHLKLKPGQRVQVSGPNGGLMTVTVVAESDTTLTFDGNHPLAGKNLFFDITLMEIVEAG